MFQDKTTKENSCPIHFVVGGARSGKSSFAQSIGESYQSPRLFVATAEPLDEEMRLKIEFHKEARANRWVTIEEPLHVDRILVEQAHSCNVILVDCITLWISNLLLYEKLERPDFEEKVGSLETALKRAPCPVILVSNEVGMGIVPETGLGRLFREYAGYANQRIASIANTVTLCFMGLHIRVKEESVYLETDSKRL